MPRLLIVATMPMTLRAFLLPFAAHFRARGFRVDGVAAQITSDEACVKAFDNVWNVEWSRNPLSLKNFSSKRGRLLEIVEREGYDIVHVHTPVAALLTRYELSGLRAQGRVRVVYTAHGFHFYEGGPFIANTIFRTLEKLAGRWTDQLVVINREDERAARRHQIVPGNRVRYMPGIGVDTKRYAAESVSAAAIGDVRRELAVPDDAPLFLMVAEFHPRKRHCDILHAFARCQSPRAVLAFAGDGASAKAMRQLAVTLGISDRVRFLSWRTDIPALMRAARAVILPSAREGLPRSIMEALCLGVAVIGTRIRGITDLLDDGRGILVPLGDVDALAAALRRLADHPEDAAAMGERGRQAMSQFDLDTVIRLHEKLYADVLATLPARTEATSLQTIS